MKLFPAILLRFSLCAACFCMMVFTSACASSRFRMVQSKDDVNWQKVRWMANGKACFDLAGYKSVQYERFEILVPAPETKLVFPVDENTSQLASAALDEKMPYGQMFRGIVRRTPIPPEISTMTDLNFYLVQQIMLDTTVISHSCIQTVWKGIPAVKYEIRSRLPQNGMIGIRKGYCFLDGSETGFVFTVFWQGSFYEEIRDVDLKTPGELFLSLVNFPK